MTWGLAGLVGWLFWLRGGGERYRGVEQVEGAALVGGGVGEHGDFGAGEADLVAGEGGQVSKQAAEAAQRGAGGVVLGGPLASALAERCLGATGLSRWDGCSSVNVIGAQALRRCQTR